MSEINEEVQTDNTLRNEESPIENLPEELLMYMMTFLGPYDLVHSIRPVCRKFCRLSRDPALWRFQELVYRPGEDEIFEAVLQGAPFINKLDLTGLSDECHALHTVLAGGCEIPVLAIGDDLSPKNAIKVVETYRDSLEELSIGRLWFKRTDYEALFDILDSINIKRLKLGLRASIVEYAEQYEFDGKPAKERSLQSLEIYSHRGDIPMSTMAKLIATHCVNLKHFSYEYQTKRPIECADKRIMETLAMCKQMREVRLWSTPNLAMLDELPCLESVTLTCENDCGDEASSCNEFFCSSSTIVRLKHLCLRYHECQAVNVLPVVTRRCPQLKSLTLRCSATTPNDLKDSLERLLNLESLTLIGAHYLHPGFLDEWRDTTAPRLRRLVLIGTARFCPWVCWAEAVIALRLLRPWITIRLKECEHFRQQRAQFFQAHLQAARQHSDLR